MKLFNILTVTDFDDACKTIEKKVAGEWYDGMTDAEGNALEKPKFDRDAVALAKQLQLQKMTFRGKV